ncbi:hypothetical protein [Tessaracoccus sp. OH4464_COT-324]|uniref:hypothetical protein n=1 Tax=Tessaracoccus sp. OH4464_COT-324 TaxID=2491059 RepID=UPI000F637A67|nr:hypothetical protein [Tessaracoccus sp. OH4464_COT-324]RRD47871.1 hypothetical protein EII42_01080 [Tessaracoccus sp. OH4464_COT-324]
MWNVVRDRLAPLSFGLSLSLTGLSSVAVIAAGIASLVSRTEQLGFSTGITLLIYGVLMFGVVVLSFLRFQWAWGMLVAANLLNAFAVGSFLSTADPGQFWLALTSLVFIAVAGIAAILPSTRLAMHR